MNGQSASVTYQRNILHNLPFTTFNSKLDSTYIDYLCGGMQPKKQSIPYFCHSWVKIFVLGYFLVISGKPKNICKHNFCFAYCPWKIVKLMQVCATQNTVHALLLPYLGVVLLFCFLDQIWESLVFMIIILHDLTVLLPKSFI